MSILIKTIGNKRYAYLAYRNGAKVLHKYIGPAESKKVTSQIAKIRSGRTIPKKYHTFFWDTNPDNLHTKIHSRYIIERILELGDMDAVSWLQKIYSGRQIIEVLETSRKISPKSKNFWEVWYEIQTSH